MQPSTTTAGKLYPMIEPAMAAGRHVPTALVQGTAGAEGNASALGWPCCPPCLVLSDRAGRQAGKEHWNKTACAAACCHEQQQGEEPSGPWGRTRTSTLGCGCRSRGPWQLTAPPALHLHQSGCPHAAWQSKTPPCTQHRGSSYLTVSSQQKKAHNGPGAHGHSLQ